MPRDEAIREVCTAETPEDAVLAFQTNRSRLYGCKFILSVKKGTAPGFAVNQSLPGGFAIRSLFARSDLYFVDEETIDDMLAGSATFGFDHSIGLDSQIVSYMEPFITRRAQVPAHYDQVFAYMARTDVDVHPLPYLRENYSRIKDSNPRDLDRIYSKLLAFETLRTLDVKHLEVHREVRSCLTDSGLGARAQQLFAKILFDSQTTTQAQKFRFMQRCYYALLLKMAIIQLSSARRPPEEKVAEFFQFCHSHMASMWLRESVIATHYFERGQSLLFFGKVQKRQQRLFEVLDGMAWDLFHMRNLEAEMMMDPSEPARYFVPAFMTRDEGLIEVMDLCPLKAIALGETGRGPVPFFREDCYTGTCMESNDFYRRISKQYYNYVAVASREMRSQEARSRLPETIRGLEIDLGAITGVSPP